jgi:sterol desaturase/sphingolipid hydroxylase (fatty acid hydroxylase superfamily)
MWEHLVDLVPIYALGIYAVLIAIELIFESKQEVHAYRLNDTLCGLSMGGFYLGTKALMKGFTFALFFLAHEYALFDFGSSWAAFIACYFVMDFLVYCYHRFTHEVRLGWAAHVAHHSSQQFNLGATSFRQSFAEPFMEPFFYAIAALVGFDPMMALVALEVNLIYMFWVHLRRCGKFHPWIEFVFSTPSHHRVHHARNAQYLDKNYGGTFIFWDRLFGTFEEEREEPAFGILRQLNHDNPIKASLDSYVDLIADVRRAKGLLNKLGYLFMPPGWAPDGKGLTTRQWQRIAGREEFPAVNKAA